MQHIVAVAYLVVAVLRGARCHQGSTVALLAFASSAWRHRLGGVGSVVVFVAHGGSIVVERVLIFAAVKIHLCHHLANLVFLKHILLQQQRRRQLQQLIVLAQVVIDAGNVRRHYLGKSVVRLQFLKVAQC